MTNESYTIDFEDQEPASGGYHIQFQDQPASEQAPGPNWAERLHQAAKYGVFGWGGMLLARDPDPTAERRTGSGIWDAIKAGYQGSASGMILRGDLPTVTLDPHHAKWYERALSQATGVISDLPEMAVGSAVSGLAGIETGPGALALGAAGAFAVPTAIRSALTQAYSKGRVTSAGDFLTRTGIVIKDTGESAVVGGATGAAGALAGKIASPFLADAVASGRIGAGTAEALGRALTASGEYGGIVVTPAVLEGRLPEKQDFLDAAVLIGGLKGAHVISSKLMGIYSKTGVSPLQVAADAKADPTIRENLLAEPEAGAEAAPELPPTYQAAAARQAAADAFPGEKAQQVLDRPFADIPETKLPHQLNMAYINGPDDLRALEARMAEVYEPEINAARQNVQTWAETEQKAAEQYASMTGAELEKVLAGRNPGDTANAVELKIRGDILMQATVEAAKAVKAVQDAGNQLTDEMKGSALAAIHRLAMIQADFTGASSELGRALNYLKRIKEVQDLGKPISDLVELYGGDPEELLKMASRIEDPETLARASRGMNKANTWDKIIEFWKAGLISGPTTHVKKFLSNATFTALHPVVDTLATGISNASYLLGASGERMSVLEPAARVIGNLMSVRAGLRAAKETLLDLGHAEQGEQTRTESEHRASAIGGSFGDVVRTPFRLLGADGSLFRVMNEHGEAAAQAVRQAAKEGLNPLTNEWRQRVAELYTNPTEATLDQMQKFGQRATFHAPMGEATQKFSKFVSQARFGGAPLLKFLFPFIGTPTNILKEMARLTPLAPAVPEWREAISKGGVPAQQAVAEIALGCGASAIVASLAAAGNISGNGDPDPSKRRSMLASGWQPYSVKVNGKWYSYQNFHPVGTAIGMAADMVDVWEHLTPEEQDKVPKLLGTAFAKSITEQSFLMGLATFTEAMTEPDRKAAAFVQKLAAGFVPNIVGQTASLTDPYKREIDSVLEAVQARIPGLREQLPAQRDPYGEKVESNDRLGWISPVTETTASEDKVRTEAARLGVGVEKAPKAVSLPTAGMDRSIGRIELTPDERDLYAVASGHMAHRVLTSLVNRPSWDVLPDDLKRKAFETVFERSRLAGKAAALPPERLQSESVRIADEIHKRLSSPEGQE